MWLVYYDRALEIARERADEAARDRLAHLAEAGTVQPRLATLRRHGAVIAAGIARRLDECVAQEELLSRTIDERSVSPAS